MFNGGFCFLDVVGGFLSRNFAGESDDGAFFFGANIAQEFSRFGFLSDLIERTSVAHYSDLPCPAVDLMLSTSFCIGVPVEFEFLLGSHRLQQLSRNPPSLIEVERFFAVDRGFVV